jgi:hypothetical protein
LVVAVVMIGLYVGPVQKYLRVSRELQGQRAQLTRLEHRHDVLTAQKALLETRQGVIMLARRCGWIFNGEHPLVISDIPSRCT